MNRAERIQPRIRASPVIEAELQSDQSLMELVEFPLGGPEAGGFEWNRPAIGRADGDDDVTALIVPRMPHHVLPEDHTAGSRFNPFPSFSSGLEV